MAGSCKTELRGPGFRASPLYVDGKIFICTPRDLVDVEAHQARGPGNPKRLRGIEV
ncbi:MAG: hypothetical protein CM1200mP2_25030 [Planctomycetaceae bacterium]|nr:MAG: hypothetical protein CM1200mP2_25030 [Planctomycetaceae bacterium]